MTVLILTETDLRSCVSMDMDSYNAVSEAFTRLAQGKATVPPIMRVDIVENQGEVDVKTAYLRGLDHFAIKIASGFHDNRARGLPTGSGMMVVLSTQTGFPEAILLDNGYLTDLRTGLAGAIAAEHLARKHVETAGIIGAGTQARFQMRGLKLVRDFKRVLVYGIAEAEVDAYVTEMTDKLGVEVKKGESYSDVVRGSDVVVTATPAHEPYLESEWLHPGLHITCMGSDSEDKQEIEADVFSSVDIIACDLKSQCFRLGELHHAVEKAVITKDHPIVELGEMTSGQKPGRQHEDQISICDLTGVGVQDTAIALQAYTRAKELGFGFYIED
jgi:ectoine utilization protein EutC